MRSDWVVLLEAAKPPFGAALDSACLYRLLETVSGVRPVVLYSADRYALQLQVVASSPTEALALALSRWSDAVQTLGTPVWELVRAEVMTRDELDLELELAERNAEAGPTTVGANGRRGEAGDDGAAGAAGAAERAPANDGGLAADLRWRLMLQDSSELHTLLSSDGTVLFSVAPVETGLLISDDGGPTRFADVVHPDDAHGAKDALAQVLAGTAESVTFTARFRAEDGWRWYESTARNLLHDHVVGAIVVNSEDISERKQLEERLAELTTHDELTGLYNRVVFLDNLELILARSDDQFQTAVFFVDIDDFRGLAQQVGAPGSDRLLVALAERLRTVRDEAIAARLGGDEFALLCEGVTGAAEVAEIARHVADLLAEPVAVDGQERSLTVSVGAALGKAGMLQPATLLRHAEVAMYRARRGRARYEIFKKRRRSPTASDLPGQP
jgi:diguanylate cyclase (GGDEF)-like protein